jgi:hypothetical protein
MFRELMPNESLYAYYDKVEPNVEPPDYDDDYYEDDEDDDEDAA